MNRFTNETEKIIQLLQEKMEHHFLDKYVSTPKLDMEKLALIQFLANQKGDLTALQRERYILTSMLVQIALDIHETIPSDTDGERESIQKQLTVLAGDYYSGLYYLLLAETEDMAFIHTLATAIKEINERKVMLYYYSDDKPDEVIRLMNEIDTAIPYCVAGYLYDEESAEHCREWLFSRKSGNKMPFLLNEKWQNIEIASNRLLLDTLSRQIEAARDEIKRFIEKKHHFLIPYFKSKMDHGDSICSNVEEG